MPLSIRWKNFRSLADSGVRELRPLTIVLGPNNSGKTSLIAPLLLLQQTIDATNASTALLTKGPTLDFGHFIDLVRDHDPEARVSFMLEWHNHGTPRDATHTLGMDPPGAVELDFKSGPDGSTSLEALRIYDTFRRRMIERTRLGSGRYSLRGLSALDKSVIPDAQISSSPDHAKTRAAVRRAIRASAPERFFFEGSWLIDREAVARSNHPEDAGPSRVYVEPDRESRLYGLIVDTVRYALVNELQSLTYIGPLRERARRLYALSGEMPRNVGTRGENAPEILFRWRDDDRIDDVNRWLGRFGFRDDLELEPQGAGAFALSWKNEAAIASGTAFVDMGFGLSQILPIIVQGVLSNPGSTIIAEQPEIHLNPRLQTELAELFSFFVDRGVNVVTETHSEHLLLAVRRLIAQGKLSASQVALYFVERSDRDSTVREVPIEQDGNIDAASWPTGFFGDALRESLALAAAQFGEGA